MLQNVMGINGFLGYLRFLGSETFRFGNKFLPGLTIIVKICLSFHAFSNYMSAKFRLYSIFRKKISTPDIHQIFAQLGFLQ